MASNSIFDYLSNVAQSVKFAAVETIEETMPKTKSLIHENREAVKELYKDFLDVKQSLPRLNMIQDNTVFKMANKMFNNIRSDIASGQFYHPEREDLMAQMSAMSGLMAGMGGMGDDFMAELNAIFSGDFGDEGEEGTDPQLQQERQMVTKGDALVASALFRSQSIATNCIGKAMMRMHEHGTQMQRSISNMQFAQGQKTMMINQAGWSTMTEGFNRLIDFNNQVIKVHAENSKKFYEDITNTLHESNAILKSIHAIQKKVYEPQFASNTSEEEDPTRGTDSINFSEIFKGGFNLAAYRKMVKQNVQKTPVAMMYNLISALPMMMQSFVDNPLHEMAKTVINGVVGGQLQYAMQRLDSAIENAFVGGLAKLYDYGKNNKDTVLGQIAQVFGFKQERKNLFQIDTSKYEKGAMSWNGIAQKALVEVIPTHLARIDAAITGTDQRHFDFKSGKWINAKELTKRNIESLKEDTKAAMSGMLSEQNELIKNWIDNMIGDEAQKRKMEKQLKYAANAMAMTLMTKGTMNEEAVDALRDNLDQVNSYIGNKDYKIKNKHQFDHLISTLIESLDRHTRATTTTNMQKVIAASNKERQENISNGGLDALIASGGVTDFNRVRKQSFNVNGAASAAFNIPLTKLEDHRGNTLYDYQYMILERLYDMNGFGSSSGGGSVSPGSPNGNPQSGGATLLQRMANNRTQRVDANKIVTHSTINTERRKADQMSDDEQAQLRNLQRFYPLLLSGVLPENTNLSDEDKFLFEQALDLYTRESDTNALIAKMKALEDYDQHKAKVQARYKSKTGTMQQVQADYNKELDSTYWDYLGSLSDDYDVTKDEIIQNEMINTLDINKKLLEAKRAAAVKSASSFTDIWKGDGTRDTSKYHQLPEGVSAEDGLLDQLMKANDLGAKMDVIRHNFDALVDSPRVMLTSVIGKAEGAIYDVLFGKNVGEVDENGKPIKGIFDKMVHDANKLINEGASGLAGGLKSFFGEIKKIFGTDENGEKGLLSFIGDFVNKQTGIDVDDLGNKVKIKARKLGHGAVDSITKAMRAQGKTIKNVAAEAMNTVGLTNDKGEFDFGRKINDLLTDKNEQETPGAAFGSNLFGGNKSWAILSKGEAVIPPQNNIYAKAAGITNYGVGTDYVKSSGLYPLAPGSRVINARENVNNPFRAQADLNMQSRHEDSIRNAMRYGTYKMADFVPGYAKGTDDKTPTKDMSAKELMTIATNGNVSRDNRLLAMKFLRAKGIDTSQMEAKLNITNEQLFRRLQGSDLSNDQINSVLSAGSVQEAEKIITQIWQQLEENGILQDKSKRSKNKQALRALVDYAFYSPQTKQKLRVLLSGLEKDDKGEIRISKGYNQKMVDAATDEKKLNRMSYRDIDVLRSVLKELGLKNQIGSNEQIAQNKFSQKQGPITGIRQLWTAMFGSDPKEGVEKTVDYTKENLGTWAKGGAAGALLSAVFPLGGPFMGALVGAAANTLNKSKSFNDYIFGTEISRDEKTGKVKRENDGLISQKTQAIMNKYLPDMKKYAKVGAIAGLITPFGPLGGAMIGAASSIIKNNAAINRALFGDTDGKGGLLGKNAKQKIKKALPHMGAAMLGTFFLGPFGLLGNAVLGAGIGFVSTTEMFKKTILGAKGRDGKRRGGLAGVIRRQIVDPLKSTMQDFKDNFGSWFKEKIFNPVAEGLKPIGKVAIGMTEKGLKAAFKKLSDTFQGNNSWFAKFLPKRVNDLFSAAREAGGWGKLFVQKVGGWAAEQVADKVKKFGHKVEDWGYEHGMISDDARGTAEYYKRKNIDNNFSRSVNTMAEMDEDTLKAVKDQLQLVNSMNQGDVEKQIKKMQNRETEMLTGDIEKLAQEVGGPEGRAISKIGLRYQTIKDLKKLDSVKGQAALEAELFTGTRISKENKEKILKYIETARKNVAKYQSNMDASRDPKAIEDQVNNLKKMLNHSGTNEEFLADMEKLTQIAENEVDTRSNEAYEKENMKKEKDGNTPAEKLQESQDKNTEVINKQIDATTKLTSTLQNLIDALTVQYSDDKGYDPYEGLSDKERATKKEIADLSRKATDPNSNKKSRNKAKKQLIKKYGINPDILKQILHDNRIKDKDADKILEEFKTEFANGNIANMEPSLRTKIEKQGITKTFNDWLDNKIAAIEEFVDTEDDDNINPPGKAFGDNLFTNLKSTGAELWKQGKESAIESTKNAWANLKDSAKSGISSFKTNMETLKGNIQSSSNAISEAILGKSATNGGIASGTDKSGEYKEVETSEGDIIRYRRSGIDGSWIRENSKDNAAAEAKLQRKNALQERLTTAVEGIANKMGISNGKSKDGKEEKKGFLDSLLDLIKAPLSGFFGGIFGGLGTMASAWLMKNIFTPVKTRLMDFGKSLMKGFTTIAQAPLKAIKNWILSHKKLALVLGLGGYIGKKAYNAFIDTDEGFQTEIEGYNGAKTGLGKLSPQEQRMAQQLLNANKSEDEITQILKDRRRELKRTGKKDHSANEDDEESITDLKDIGSFGAHFAAGLAGEKIGERFGHRYLGAGIGKTLVSSTIDFARTGELPSIPGLIMDVGMGAASSKAFDVITDRFKNKSSDTSESTSSSSNNNANNPNKNSKSSESASSSSNNNNNASSQNKNNPNPNNQGSPKSGGKGLWGRIKDSKLVGILKNHKKAAGILAAGGLLYGLLGGKSDKGQVTETAKKYDPGISEKDPGYYDAKGELGLRKAQLEYLESQGERPENSGNVTTDAVINGMPKDDRIHLSNVAGMAGMLGLGGLAAGALYKGAKALPKVTGEAMTNNATSGWKYKLGSKFANPKSALALSAAGLIGLPLITEIAANNVTGNAKVDMGNTQDNSMSGLLASIAGNMIGRRLGGSVGAVLGGTTADAIVSGENDPESIRNNLLIHGGLEMATKIPYLVRGAYKNYKNTGNVLGDKTLGIPKMINGFLDNSPRAKEFLTRHMGHVGMEVGHHMGLTAATEARAAATATGALKSAHDAKVEEKIATITGKIKSGCETFKNVALKLLPKGCGPSVEKFFERILTKISDPKVVKAAIPKLAKQTLLAGFTGGLGLALLNGAFATKAFFDAYERNETARIFDTEPKYVTTQMQWLAGLSAGLVAFIPFIGPFLDVKDVVDIAVDTVGKFLGFSKSDLQKKSDEESTSTSETNPNGAIPNTSSSMAWATDNSIDTDKVFTDKGNFKEDDETKATIRSKIQEDLKVVYDTIAHWITPKVAIGMHRYGNELAYLIFKSSKYKESPQAVFDKIIKSSPSTNKINSAYPRGYSKAHVIFNKDPKKIDNNQKLMAGVVVSITAGLPYLTEYIKEEEIFRNAQSYLGNAINDSKIPDEYKKTESTKDDPNKKTTNSLTETKNNTTPTITKSTSDTAATNKQLEEMKTTISYKIIDNLKHIYQYLQTSLPQKLSSNSFETLANVLSDKIAKSNKFGQNVVDLILRSRIERGYVISAYTKGVSSVAINAQENSRILAGITSAILTNMNFLIQVLTKDEVIRSISSTLGPILGTDKSSTQKNTSTQNNTNNTVEDQSIFTKIGNFFGTIKDRFMGTNSDEDKKYMQQVKENELSQFIPGYAEGTDVSEGDPNLKSDHSTGIVTGENGMIDAAKRMYVNNPLYTLGSIAGLGGMSYLLQKAAKEDARYSKNTLAYKYGAKLGKGFNYLAHTKIGSKIAKLAVKNPYSALSALATMKTLALPIAGSFGMNVIGSQMKANANDTDANFSTLGMAGGALGGALGKGALGVAAGSAIGSAAESELMDNKAITGEDLAIDLAQNAALVGTPTMISKMNQFRKNISNLKSIGTGQSPEQIRKLEGFFKTAKIQELVDKYGSDKTKEVFGNAKDAFVKKVWEPYEKYLGKYQDKIAQGKSVIKDKASDVLKSNVTSTNGKTTSIGKEIAKGAAAGLVDNNLIRGFSGSSTPKGNEANLTKAKEIQAKMVDVLKDGKIAVEKVISTRFPKHASLIPRIQNIIDMLITKVADPKALNLLVPKLGAKSIVSGIINFFSFTPIVMAGKLALGIWTGWNDAADVLRKANVKCADNPPIELKIGFGLLYGLLSMIPYAGIFFSLSMPLLARYVAQEFSPEIKAALGEEENEDKAAKAMNETNEENIESQSNTSANSSLENDIKTNTPSGSTNNAMQSLGQNTTNSDLEELKSTVSNKLKDLLETIKNSLTDYLDSNILTAFNSYEDKLITEATSNSALNNGYRYLHSNSKSLNINSIILNTNPTDNNIRSSYQVGSTTEAYNILNMPKGSPTISMKTLAGIVKATMDNASFLVKFIPNTKILDIALETIGKILGINKALISETSTKFTKKQTESKTSSSNITQINNKVNQGKSNAWNEKAGSSNSAGNVEKNKQSLTQANIDEKSSNKSTWQSVKDSVSNAWESVKSTASNAWDKAKELGSRAWNAVFGNGKGLGGASLDPWSQLNPNYDGVRFNTSNDTQMQYAKDSWCGPLSASYGMHKLGLGGDNPFEAANYVLSHNGKEKDGGTYPSALQNYAKSKGADTFKVTNQKQAQDLINDGGVLLTMGKESSVDNTGEGRTTPYGKNPHWLTVSKDGVHDSESSGRNRSYNVKDILNHSTEMIGMKRGKNNTTKITGKRFGRSKYGRGNSLDGVTEQDVLKRMMYIAAALAKKCGSNHPELFFAQMIHETGGPANYIKANKAAGIGDDHNYGGFTWYPEMGEKYKGAPRPSAEGGIYAKFDTDDEYIERAYNDVYKRYASKLAQANTPEEFARILKSEGYYTAPESEYVAGLKSALNTYSTDLKNIGNINVSTTSVGSSSSSSSSTSKVGGLFGALAQIASEFSSIFSGTSSSNNSNSSSSNGAPGSGTRTTGGITGDGNTMHIDAQTGGNCTIEATRSMVKAYTDKDEPKRNEQFGWWNPTLENNLKGQWNYFGNTPEEKAKFENFISNHFSQKPGNPLFLYQTGGDGKSGNHPINKGQGDHATVIGRKLSNGKYEHYDSAGGVVKEFNLGDIFDPSARGGTQGMAPGQGNSIVEPQMDPSRPIANWQGSTPTAQQGQGKFGRSKYGKGMIGKSIKFIGKTILGNEAFDEASAAFAQTHPNIAKAIELAGYADVTAPIMVSLDESDRIEKAIAEGRMTHEEAYKRMMIIHGHYNYGEGSKNKSRFGMSKYGMDRSTPEMTSQIWQYLKSKGLSNVAAAGILGNFQAESNMYSDRLQNHDPSNGYMDITVDGNTGYGLAQWTNSSRQQALKDYAQSVGQQAGDWKTQIDFMLSGKDGNIGPLIQAMDASGDPAKAALLFHDQYEVSADNAEKKQRRANFAQQFFNSQGQGIVDGSSNISSGGSSGNSGGMFGFLSGMMSKITAPIKAGWSRFTGALSKAFANNPAIKKISELMFGGNPFESLLGFGSSSSSSGGAASVYNGPINVTEAGKKIVAEARTHIGKPYVMGANGPNAYDCSSHAQTSYAAAGLDIPRQADYQYEFFKEKNAVVSIEQAQPGDLIFFSNTYQDGTPSPNDITHVGIVTKPGDANTLVMCHAGKPVAEITLRDWDRQHLPTDKPPIGSLALAFPSTTATQSNTQTGQLFTQEEKEKNTKVVEDTGLSYNSTSSNGDSANSSYQPEDPNDVGLYDNIDTENPHILGNGKRSRFGRGKEESYLDNLHEANNLEETPKPRREKWDTSGKFGITDKERKMANFGMGSKENDPGCIEYWLLRGYGMEGAIEKAFEYLHKPPNKNNLKEAQQKAAQELSGNTKASSSVDKYKTNKPVPNTNKDKSRFTAPNGLRITDNDINYLKKNGYTEDQALELLKKEKIYTDPVTEAEIKKSWSTNNNISISTPILTNDKKAQPNGDPRDLKTWLSQGYGMEAAMEKAWEAKNGKTVDGKPLKQAKKEKEITERQKEINKIKKEAKKAAKISEKRNDQMRKTGKAEPVVDEIAPNGKHYTKNDVDYLISKGYTREDAIAFLATVPKYQKKDEDKDLQEIAPNGKPYEKNDIDYLLKNGYSRKDAIWFLSQQDKYKNKDSKDLKKKIDDKKKDQESEKKSMYQDIPEYKGPDYNKIDIENDDLSVIKSKLDSQRQWIEENPNETSKEDEKLINQTKQSVKNTKETMMQPKPVEVRTKVGQSANIGDQLLQEQIKTNALLTQIFATIQNAITMVANNNKPQINTNTKEITNPTMGTAKALLSAMGGGSNLGIGDKFLPKGTRRGNDQGDIMSILESMNAIVNR